jgi:hypothetical protein
VGREAYYRSALPYRLPRVSAGIFHASQAESVSFAAISHIGMAILALGTSNWFSLKPRAIANNFLAQKRMPPTY